MTPKTFWILVVSQRWHAWVSGNQRSVCGYVDAQFLIENPALATIEGIKNLPAEKLPLACKVCRRKLGLYGIREAATDETVRAWVGFIDRHLEVVRGRLRAVDAKALGVLLSEIGHPDDSEAQEVWNDVRGFLLAPFRVTKGAQGHTRVVVTLPCVSKVVALLPRGIQVLQQVSRALRSWRATAGSLTYGRYHADQVVQAMLEIPDVDAYVRHLKGRGLEQFAAVFHPNTLARAKREPALRGVFAGTGTYWEATRSQLNIVEE